MLKKIVFITKSLCYHQIHLADELHRLFDDGFAFVQVREPLKFRVENKQEGFERPYLVGLSKSEEERNKALSLIETADVVIQGEASSKYLRHCKKNCLILRYSERIYKNGYYKKSFVHSLRVFFGYWALRLRTIGRKSFLLSASGFAPLDYSKFRLFRKKAYKWGYFPLFVNQDLEKLIKEKAAGKLTILWVSRLIGWKHPEDAVLVAKHLKARGIDFCLKIIGDGDETSGELKNEVRMLIEENGLGKYVKMLGKLKPEEVAAEYEKCNIALFTSSFAEGWGVGVNEAMNAACAIIASSAMGSVPYLIQHGFNGFVYEYGKTDELLKWVEILARDTELREKMSKNAYNVLKEYWTPHIAAVRLSHLINHLLNDKKTPYDIGPCSPAPIIKNTWFKNKNRRVLDNYGIEVESNES